MFIWWIRLLKMFCFIVLHAANRLEILGTRDTSIACCAPKSIVSRLAALICAFLCVENPLMGAHWVALLEKCAQHRNKRTMKSAHLISPWISERTVHFNELTQSAKWRHLAFHALDWWECEYNWAGVMGDCNYCFTIRKRFLVSSGAMLLRIFFITRSFEYFYFF